MEALKTNKPMDEDRNEVKFKRLEIYMSFIYI